MPKPGCQDCAHAGSSLLLNRLPCAGAPLCIFDLLRRHPVRNDATLLQCVFKAASTSEVEPLVRFHVIRCDGFPVDVHYSKITLRLCIPLICCPLIPLVRFSVVLRNAFAVHAHDSEGVLRICIPL